MSGMNTAEIERLYIAAAADFNILMDDKCAEPYDRLLVASFDGYNVCVYDDKDNGWQWQWRNLDREPARFRWLPRPVAVAAMTESWRERLEREYKVYLEPIGREVPFGHPIATMGPSDGWQLEGWQVTRLGKSPVWLCDGAWKSFDGLSHSYAKLSKSLPAAIVAAVKALAAEKREKQEKAKRQALFATGLPAGLAGAFIRDHIGLPPSDGYMTATEAALIDANQEWRKSLADKLFPRRNVIKLNHRIDKLDGRTERQGRTIADLVATNEALLARVEALEGARPVVGQTIDVDFKTPDGRQVDRLVFLGPVVTETPGASTPPEAPQ